MVIFLQKIIADEHSHCKNSSQFNPNSKAN